MKFNRIKINHVVFLISFIIGTTFVISSGIIIKNFVSDTVIRSTKSELSSTTAVVRDYVSSYVNTQINSVLDEHLDILAKNIKTKNRTNLKFRYIYYYISDSLSLNSKMSPIEKDIAKLLEAKNNRSNGGFIADYIDQNYYFVKSRILKIRNIKHRIVVYFNRRSLNKIIDIGELNNLVARTKLGMNGYPFIFDYDGNVVAHPKFTVQNLIHIPSVNKMCNMKDGEFYYSWKNPGEKTWVEKFVVFKSINDINWIVGSAVLETEISAPINHVKNVFLNSGIFLVVLIAIISIFFGKAIQAYVDHFLRSFQEGAQGNLAFRMQLNGPREIYLLKSYFNVFMEQLEQRRNIADHIHQQVAHDIRSPIAALTVVTQTIDNIPEEQRILIRQAVQRIEDIANDLASRKINSQTVMDNDDTKIMSAQMVSGILDLIVSEKRMQFRSHCDLRIDCNITKKSYGLFANIHENTFKRVFSNLINNAVEALGQNGHIQVNLLSEGNNLLIQVNDNGKGIASEVLPKLMQRGETHGKKEGKGLGLFHARETVESWGGRMEIRSEVGKGTEIRILLPKTSAPDWFLPELRISNYTRVIIIDDDSSIHQIWTGRFKTPQFCGNEIFHFSSAANVLKTYSEQPKIFEGDVVILCDLELRGENINGLTLMRNIKATKRTVLVTSRFEEPNVRAECRDLGIKLIPKNLAGFVPIIVDAEIIHPTSQEVVTESIMPVSPDVILIDDQEMIHKTWKMMAKVKNINLQTFYTADEFFSICGSFDSNCRIYIDSNLANGLKGEDIAKAIYEKGFINIHLATGSDTTDFPPMPWIKSIIGKHPAF